jgi:lysyl-tRNA synthetase class 2
MLLLSSLFGVGAALILDEFALILHLEDVYWTAEGRSSIEAILMGFAFGSLCLLAAAPVGSQPGDDLPHWAVAGVLTVNLALAIVCFLKGKPRLGTIGILIPGVAAVGAIRLALPSSLWARRFYRNRKLMESTRRERAQHLRHTRLRHRVYDAIGGAPHLDRQARPRQ